MYGERWGLHSDALPVEAGQSSTLHPSRLDHVEGRTFHAEEHVGELDCLEEGTGLRSGGSVGSQLLDVAVDEGLFEREGVNSFLV